VLSPKPDTHGLRSERVERAHSTECCTGFEWLQYTLL
jgi:hypothetical protein